MATNPNSGRTLFRMELRRDGTRRMRLLTSSAAEKYLSPMRRAKAIFSAVAASCGNPTPVLATALRASPRAPALRRRARRSPLAKPAACVQAFARLIPNARGVEVFV